MRNFIIRLLGGETRLDVLRATNRLNQEINELKKQKRTIVRVKFFMALEEFESNFD